jgi:hypothetical protein
MALTTAHTASRRSWLLASFLAVAIILALVIHDATGCDTGYSLRQRNAGRLHQPTHLRTSGHLAGRHPRSRRAGYFSSQALKGPPGRRPSALKSDQPRDVGVGRLRHSEIQWRTAGLRSVN